MAVRVDAFDTTWSLRDFIKVVQNAPRLEMILLPKAGTAFDEQVAGALIGSLGRGVGRTNPIGLVCLIETILGLANVERITVVTPRLEGMTFGIGDCSIGPGTYGEIIASSDPRYAVETGAAGSRKRWPADQWHVASARMANACQAHDLRATDGYGSCVNYPDTVRVISSVERASTLGCRGKWAVHIGQVEPSTAVFTPPADHVAAACEILTESDIATFIPAPFCGAVLANFGAEVIRIEKPGEGDPLRRFGAPADGGLIYLWLSDGRNKKSIPLNLGQRKGASLFRDMVRHADIVLENLRPGTMRKWRPGNELLSESNPGLITLRVPAPCQWRL